MKNQNNLVIRIYEYEFLLDWCFPSNVLSRAIVPCIFGLILFWLPFMAFSQDETLLPQKFASGYYGGPIFSVTNFADEVGLFVGGKGGWVVNRKFALGGSGALLINDVEFGLKVPADSAGALADTTLTANLYYGGLEFGYMDSPWKLFHYSVWLQIGIGLVGYRDYQCSSCGSRSDLDNDLFFFTEPRIDLNLNVAKMVRLSSGIGWRYAYDIELRGISNQDFQGPIGVIAVRIGRY